MLLNVSMGMRSRLGGQPTLLREVMRDMANVSDEPALVREARSGDRDAMEAVSRMRAATWRNERASLRARNRATQQAMAEQWLASERTHADST